MSEIAITVENLSKAYRIGLKEEIPDTLTAAALSWAKAPLRNLRRLQRLNTFSCNGEEADDTIWALKDVSFEVPRGEVLGIIGRNGAGKSTLLKVLSRITDPTSGRAVIRGRVSSLLEVGTGFHPELTGRENIYMNGTILGMRKREIDRKFEQIVEFSGVAKFLDTPVKRYSSGMKVRLAFAVAAHLEPEILIIDEVLAVGDQEFQNKCLGKMNEVATSGRTVLFVSHNMAAVEALCTRCIILSSGQLKLDGETQIVIQHYNSTGRRASSQIDLTKVVRTTLCENPVITQASIYDSQGNPASGIPIGDQFTVRLELCPNQPIKSPSVSIHILAPNGSRISTLQTRHQFAKPFSLDSRCFLNCTVEDVRLIPGIYTLNISLWSGKDCLEKIDSVLGLEVIACDVYGTGYLPNAKHGVYVPRTTWAIEEFPSRSDFNGSAHPVTRNS